MLAVLIRQHQLAMQAPVDSQRRFVNGQAIGVGRPLGRATLKSTSASDRS